MTSDNPPPHPVYDAPGCGLLSYSCILIFFFLVGIFGMMSSVASFFYANTQPQPFFLVPGNQVQVWRLQPMRDAKLLELTEIPLFYHDESQNGTKSCALSKDSLLRVDGDNAWKIPYSDIQSVKIIYENEREVAVSETKTGEDLPCFFGPSEGSEKFRFELARILSE